MAPGVTAMERDADGALALATWGDGVFYGPTAGGAVENPTSWRVSLQVTDVARIATARGPVLWFTSRARHHASDPPNLAIAGPDGAARVALQEDGTFGSFTHFVRDSNRGEDVKGLPSSDVRDVLPAGDGAVLLACGRERVDNDSYDRAEEAPFLLEGAPLPGGVARVAADDTVTIVTTSAQTPDPRVLAWDGAGALLVGDAEVGLVRVTDAGVVAVDLGTSVPAGAIPNALWVGAGDDLAVGFDRGVFVRLGGLTVFVDTVGFAWTARAFGPGVLVGSDDGLLAIGPTGAAFPAFDAVPTASAPPFETVTADGGGTGGDCLGAGEVCAGGGTPCCAGLSCGGSGFVTMCQ